MKDFEALIREWQAYEDDVPTRQISITWLAMCGYEVHIAIIGINKKIEIDVWGSDLDDAITKVEAELRWHDSMGVY